MHRRDFLQKGLAVGLTLPLWACAQKDSDTAAAGATDSAAAPAAPAADPRLARIGITTVCLRSRFAQTRTLGEPTTKPDMTLLTAPQVIADELGLHNVEVWDAHFDDTSIAYCEQVKAAAQKVGSRISNIQIDGLADLSSPDKAVRDKGIAQAKEWMDRAVALGAPSIRVNTGGKEGGKMPLETTADSFRQIAEYGQQVSKIVLVENHTGYSRNIDNVVALVNAVNHPNCAILCDYGNTFGGGQEERMAALKKLFGPKLALVSAKGVAFDAQFKPTKYDYGALVKATEDSGYRGIYSIEMWPDPGEQPPSDPIAAAKVMKELTLANLRTA
jgi:sugar phosphate isomerase/epimerase